MSDPKRDRLVALFVQANTNATNRVKAEKGEGPMSESERAATERKLRPLYQKWLRDGFTDARVEELNAYSDEELLADFARMPMKHMAPMRPS